MTGVSWQKFVPVFASVKVRFDQEENQDKLLHCKQGSYNDCVVLKLQRAFWTNDPMDRVQNESGIFCSIWIGAEAALQNRANYNIHALKLRQLKNYSITSRDFAEEFRRRFAPHQELWPNVSTAFGPTTLMQGWVEIESSQCQEQLLKLLRGFGDLVPLLDELLDVRRKSLPSR